MTVQSLEVLGTVRADGTLELDEKLKVPPGRVKVRLEPVPEPPAEPAEGLVEFVERMRREAEAAGSHFMTEDEVSAWIAELRCDWDKRDEILERAWSRGEEKSSLSSPNEEE